MNLIDRALAFDISATIPGHSNTYGSFQEYFGVFFGWAVNIAAALAVLIIIWGGFKYVTSGGDNAKMNDAKDWIYGAVVGFGLLLLTKLLVSVLGVK